MCLRRPGATCLNFQSFGYPRSHGDHGRWEFRAPHGHEVQGWQPMLKELQELMPDVISALAKNVKRHTSRSTRSMKRL